MDFEVVISIRARRDLVSIYNFIAKEDPAAAMRFCHELAEQARKLSSFPERNKEAKRRPGARKLPYGNYIIYYDIHPEVQKVEVLRFWHAARNPRKLRLREEPAAYGEPTSAVKLEA